MKCLIATTEHTRSEFPGGFNWATPGEILVPGLMQWHLTGTESTKGATIAEVAEKPEGELVAAYFAFVKGAWEIELDENSNDEMCENLTEIANQIEHLPPGTIVAFHPDGEITPL